MGSVEVLAAPQGVGAPSLHHVSCTEQGEGKGMERMKEKGDSLNSTDIAFGHKLWKT